MILILLLRSAACNIAIKLPGPRLDRLSYRYSKVMQISDYSCEYQLPCALPQPNASIVFCDFHPKSNHEL